MKICLDCKTEKPFTDFYRNKRKNDGFDIYCKTCAGIRGAACFQKNKTKRKEKNAKWRAENPGKAAKYCAKWKEEHSERYKECQNKWYVSNRNKKLTADKVRRESNINEFKERERQSYRKHQDKRSVRCKNWRSKNPHIVTAYAASRRAAKKDRTPKWLTNEQLREIEAFYLLAKFMTNGTGVLHHVDHMVPLRGHNVSGLHAPWNLQVIPWHENLQKGNRRIG